MQQHFYALRNSFAALLVLMLVCTTAILRGQTLYIGPDNGDWLTAANWNAGLPSATNAPTVSGGKIVEINGSLTIDYAVQNFGTIINKGTTTVSTGSILSGGALENQGTLTVSSGGSVTSSGGMLNSGTVSNAGNFNSNSAWTNTVTGTLTNTATFMQLAPITNNGIVANNGGTFTCPQAFTNNKTVTNASGATFKVDFGGSFTNATGSTLTNAGSFQNLGAFTNNTTVTNTGTFTNNSIHACNGVFNNESGGRLESTATVNVAGRINNKAGATTVSGFRFNVLANGYVSSAGQFTNNDMVDVKALGTFCNETGATLTGNFGSSILNAGYFKISVSSTVSTNGSISNNKKFDNYGTYDAMGGGQITNTDSVCNFNVIKNVNIITNSGVWKNNGTTENNSGGIWTNTGKIENAKGATISNNFEVINKPTGTITNNGVFNNNIRLFNEGAITNNAYFVTAGDLFNKVGATLLNTEVLVVREGSIVNEGTLTNQKTLVNDGCSVITNKSTIGNTGRFENSGIIFQRGTVTGNAILALSGHIQTGTTSAAPSICRTALTSGVDGIGEAKVYGQNPVKANIGLDECAGFQYFVDGTTRKVYTCSQIGQTINAPFKLVTRTGDSLTCTIPITIFDNVSPVVDNCPKDATIFTLNNTAPYSWPAITALDNCGDTPSVSSTNASGSAFNIGTTQVTISVKDSRLNTTDCTFRVNVVKVFSAAVCPATDAAAPVFTGCPANQTLASTGGNVAAVWNAPSVSDNCYPIVMQQNFNSGTTFAPGVTTVTYSAKDPTGNIGTCSFTITVTAPANVCATDNIKPVINGCPPNFFGTLNTAINGAVGYWRAPSAVDNCGGIASFTANAVSGSIFPAGVTAVVYTATDIKGNTSTCTFNVSVEATNPCAGDVTAPILVCPANVSVNATGNSAVATWTAPTATDACGPVVVNATHQPGINFQVGTTTVTYCASDKVGNQSKCSFNVTVNNPCANDTLAPVITNCPANQTINSTNGLNAIATWTAPTATDNCTMAGVTSNFPSGTTFGVGTTNVVYTATDARGNVALCTFAVTVNISAVATCAGNVVLNPSFETNFTDWFTTDVATVSITNDAKSGAKAAQICGNNKPILSKLTSLLGGTYTATVQAKIAGAPTTAFVGIEFYDAAGVVIPAARITRPVTATTYAAITFTFVKPATASNFAFIANKTGTTGCLTIDDVCVTNPCTNDVTPPTFTGCPANITVNGTGTATTGIATWTAPVASDNCSTPAVISNFTSGQSFPLGATTVTYTATDSKGLTATCSFTVTYVNACANDVTPPSFSTTCPTNKTGTSTNGLCVVVNFVAPTATDNCGTPSVSGTHAADFCFPIGVTNVTYTAADAKNNKATCSFTVTIGGTTTTGGNDCAATGAVGGITRDFWNVNTGTNSPVIVPTTAPTSTSVLTRFESPMNIADNYTQRVRGYLRPTVSGNYVFFITGDDNADLFISTSSNPVNKTRIAFIHGWTNNDELYKYPSQKSATVALVAGQNYYIEAVQQEGGGGDNLAVYWQTPVTTQPTNLVTNGDFSAGNSGFNSDFEHTSTGQGCGTGYYVLGATKGSFGWATECAAPTGSSGGNRMYVDNAGDGAPDKKIWGKTIAVSANTTYTFKVNTASIYASNPARLYVQVNGVNISSIVTLPAATCQWVTVTGTWNSGTSTSAIVTIRNQNGDCNGNDFMIDDICFSGTATTGLSAPAIIAGANLVPYCDNICFYAPSVGGTVSPASQTITTAANGTVPTRHTLAGNVGTIVRWERQSPNSTVWNNWNGGGSATAPDNCCFTTVGTWKVRAIIKNGACAEVPSSEGAIVVTAPATACTQGATIAGWMYLGTYNNNYYYKAANGDVAYNVAKAAAQQIGGRLPVIKDANQNAFVQGFLANGSAWLGLERIGTTNTWATNDGSAFTYSNWQAGEPNNWGGNEDRVQMYSSGTWNDLNASGTNWTIAEVPCAASPCITNGGLIHERWLNANYNWAQPIALPTTAPSDIQILNPSDFKMPNSGITDNYVSRARGYIKPSVTGTYTFNETGDDYCELWLSTDQSSTNIKKIAFHYDWTNPTEYTKFATQTSAAITLQAGKLYYVEVRHAEGGGGDFYQVQWKTPSNTANWAIIPSANLAMPCASNQSTAAITNRVFEFEAHADYKVAQLQWVSNGGKRNDFYEVERVNNNTGDFENIGTLNAAKNDDNAHVFNFTDKNPYEGENTYRIKTILNDPTRTPQYSALKTVKFGSLDGFNVFPNPANDYVDIDLNAYNGRQVTVSVYNQFGKAVQTAQIDKATSAPFRLELNDVATGAYIIRVQAQGKREVVRKIQIIR